MVRSSASISPQPVVRRLLRWITPNTAPLVGMYRQPGPIGGIAASLVDSFSLTDAITKAHDAELDVALDGEAWHVQQPTDHPQRAGEYRACGLEWTHRQFEPERHRLGQSTIDEVAAQWRSRQIARGGTLLTQPAHFYRDTVPLGRARRTDLAFAHRFAELARRSSSGEPAPPGGRRRLVVAIIPVDPAQLARHAALGRELVAGFREVDCDAYLIWPWRFSGSGFQYRALRFLGRQLERATGRGCIYGGLWHLWPGILADGLAAACIGYGKTTVEKPGLELPAPDASAKDEDKEGWGVSFFFAEILGAAALGHNGEPVRSVLLPRLVCDCRMHLRRRLPSTQLGFHGHNLFWEEEIGRIVCADSPIAACAEFLPLVERAARNRENLGMKPLPSAWRAIGERGLPDSWTVAQPGAPPWRRLTDGQAGGLP
jgi:hypothetical protein